MEPPSVAEPALDPERAPDRAPGRGLERALAALDQTLARLLPFNTFLVTVAAVLLRQTGVPKVTTIWAEDGLIFATCAYARPLIPDCLLEPYAAWDHLVPRVGAAIAVLLPPADLSVALATIAAVVAGFAAAVVAVAVRDASGSWIAGMVGGASLVLVIQAGTEVGGNLTNLHWILIAASITWIVAWWVGARPRRGGLALLVGTGLSSPFPAILVALAVVGALLRRPSWRPILAIACVAALVQLAVNLTTPRVPPGTEHMDLGRAIRFVNVDVLDRGVFGTTRLPLNQLVLAGIVVSVVVAALLAITRRGTPDDPQLDSRWAALRAILVIAALTGAGIALFIAMLFLQHRFNVRYAYVPSALLCIGLVFGAALVGRARPVNAAGARGVLGWAAALMLPAAVLVLGLGFARTLGIERRRRLAGPITRRPRLRGHHLCRDPAVRSVRLPISPIGSPVWVLEIPCNRITVPADS